MSALSARQGPLRPLAPGPLSREAKGLVAGCPTKARSTLSRKIVLAILAVALLGVHDGGTPLDMADRQGSMVLPLWSHAPPAQTAGKQASGWTNSRDALAPDGSAYTSSDGATLTTSGYGLDGQGTISSVKVMATVSQDDHADDRLQLSVSAPGCAFSQPLALSATAKATSTTVPCTWTWAALAGAEVSFTADATGGLVGLGRTDGAWRVHHVWLQVALSNAAPVAAAGPDTLVNEAANFVLNGSASADPEGGALTYQWQQTAGPAVIMPAPGATAGIKAPMLASNQPATLVFQLTVTDPEGHASSDTVRVDVQNINQAPVARAGADQSISAGSVALSGAASSDADGDALQFTWAQLSGPTAILENGDQAVARVTPQEGRAVFRLTVADGWGGVSFDDVFVVLSPIVTQVAGPGANAGSPVEEPAPMAGRPGDGAVGGADGSNVTTAAGSGPIDRTEPKPANRGTALAALLGASWWPYALVGAAFIMAALIVVGSRRRLRRAQQAELRDAAEATPVEKAGKPERPQIVLGDLAQEERNDEIIQFLNNASHDLASPLTPIRIQLAMLENAKGDLNERQTKAWEVVKRNIDQMGLLVTDIRDAARMQAGRLALYREPLDLAVLAAQSVESFEGAATEKQVKLSLDHDGSPVHVSGDPGRLTQVLYNLINNALKFSDAGGRVQVAVRTPAAGQAVVAVRDTGIGMTPEDAARLFQPFSQAHGAAQKKKGSGLGLFISKGIIEGHDGDIWCESAGPGQGSVFAFTIALAQETPLPAMEMA